MKKWFDHNFRLMLDPMPSDNDNGELFTVEYLLLAGLFDESFNLDVKFVEMVSAVQIKAHPHIFKQRPNSVEIEDSYLASHDNVTAMMSYAFKINTAWIYEGVKIFNMFYHPRDVVFYSYLKYFNRPGVWLVRPFLWIPAIAMLVSVLDDYNDVSGDWLAFVRLESTKNKSWFFRHFYKLIKWIWRKKYGDDYLNTLAEIYFHQHDEHPIREICKTLGGL